MADPISLSFHQGDTPHYTVRYTDPNGVPIDLTGAIITGSIKAEYTSSVVGSWTVNVDDPTTGTFTLSLDATTSANLPVKGFRTSFVFDVQIAQGSNIQTIMYGYLKVTREVTQ